MSNVQREALDVYYGICEEERFCLKLHFEPGDIQFLQNHVVFHSRTEYVDGPGPKRHLMRMWLSLPDGRLLRRTWRRSGSTSRSAPGAAACRPTGAGRPARPVHARLRLAAG